VVREENWDICELCVWEGRKFGLCVTPFLPY
jgi:hypothetical protein